MTRSERLSRTHSATWVELSQFSLILTIGNSPTSPPRNPINLAHSARPSWSVMRLGTSAACYEAQRASSSSVTNKSACSREVRTDSPVRTPATFTAMGERRPPIVTVPFTSPGKIQARPTIALFRRSSRTLDPSCFGGPRKALVVRLSNSSPGSVSQSEAATRSPFSESDSMNKFASMAGHNQ